MISRFLGFNTFIWEQSYALPWGRRREGCRICHYLSWTDSIKPSLLYQTLDAVFPMDLFSDCLEITTAVIVPCGGPKGLPVHTYIVLWCLHFLVYWTVGYKTFILEQSCAQPRASRRDGCRMCHYNSWSDSIKPSLLFSNGCCISEGSFQIIYNVSVSMRRSESSTINHSLPILQHQHR